MPSIVLRNLASPTQISNSNILNTVTPLSLREWLANNIGVIPDQIEQQYNQYIKNWYQRKEDSINDNIQVNKLKQDYIALLQRLTVIFQNDEIFNRIAHIDFNSETDLKIAIPYFAKKLKEIALYYVNKRESLKKTKLKYNMVGSGNALERILYEYVLNAFTKRENNLTVYSKQIYNNIPELSCISDNFKIEIEELYDTTNYFDLEYSQQNNTTGVYDLSSVNPLVFVLEDYIANFYNAFDLSEVPLSGFSNPLSEFTLCESDSNLNEQVLAQLGSEYIGNDVCFLTGGFFDFDKRDVNLNIQVGNNFFYWFSGEYIRELPDGLFQNLSLSTINWTNATGASSYDISDIVFIQAGNVLLEGAWLLDSPVITVNDTMSATMADRKIFKFPYPGIGLSAQGMQWSGKTINDIQMDSLKFFPNENSFLNTQEQIKDLYWSSVSSISAVTPILLQDTNLYNSGAWKSTSFKQADKVIVRRDVGEDHVHDITADGNFTGTFETSWLYDFQSTEIPIKPNNNNIYFPLTAFNKTDELFFRYRSGDPIALSSIDIGSAFAGAIAGIDISNADMLIKQNSVCGPPIEAAWLKGTPLSAYNNINMPACDCEQQNYVNYYTGWQYVDGSTQPALSFKAETNQFIRFVWTGPSININDIKGLTGFEHDDACEYKKSNSFPSILNTNFLQTNNLSIYEKWRTCTCDTVKHSPLGHNKDTLLFYGTPTDFIANDIQFPDAFNVNTWIGSDNLKYNVSKDVAWFHVDNLLESDVGWGIGKWFTNTNDNFILEPGKSYIYYRSNLNRCNFTLPYLIINSPYCQCEINNCNNLNCLPVWQKAILDSNNSWIDAGTISDMILHSDEFYTYNHQDTVNFSRKILTYNNIIVNSISGDFISLSAIDPNISYSNSKSSYLSINFLIKIPLVNNDPYWGQASYGNNSDTQNKRLMYGTANANTIYDYLQIKQPLPSDTLLSDDDVIEYQLSPCNECFIWNQPLTFSVQHPIRQWNKIYLDSCVKSDILNYMHEQGCSPCSPRTNNCLSECQDLNLCGCTSFCYTTKTGVTASDIASDIQFNTELSGIPVFVNYFARNAFPLNFQVIETTNGIPPSGGIWVPPISSIYSKAQIPWMNISNELYPLVASEQTNNLYTKKQLGIFTPENLGTGRYELKNGKYQLNYINRDSNSFDLVRNDNYFDSPLDVVSSDSQWMKHKQGQGFSGNVKVDGHQTYYPYTTNYEINKFNEFGLFDSSNTFSPWDEKGKWKYSDTFPANFRNELPINCGPNAWYNNQLELTGNVKQWQTDVFGNQYFLMFNDSNTKLDSYPTYGEFLIKLSNGKIFSANDSLSGFFNKLKNINFATDNITNQTYLVTEDGNVITTENGYYFIVGQ